jgi:predicted transcriptional regulator
MPIKSPCAACANHLRDKTICAVHCLPVRIYADNIKHGISAIVPPPNNPNAIHNPQYFTTRQYHYMQKEDIEVIKKMAAKGRSNQEIADAIGFTKSAVYRALKRGLTSSNARKSKEEKRKMLELYLQGNSFYMVAQIMHTNWDTVKRAVQQTDPHSQTA